MMNSDWKRFGVRRLSVSCVLGVMLIIIFDTAMCRQATAQCQAGGAAYVTGLNEVLVIDTSTNTIVTTVPIMTANSAAVTPDGSEVYVSRFELSGFVDVIDTTTNLVTASIVAGLFPNEIAILPDGSEVYVVNAFADSVTVISTVTKTAITTIPLTGATRLAVSSDSTEVYVTSPGGVSTIDTATKALSGPVALGSSPAGCAVTPDGTELYVANGLDTIVSVVDPSTDTVIDTIGVVSGVGVTMHPDGSRVYVSSTGTNMVSVIDTGTHAVIATVMVGSVPSYIHAHPSGSEVYVVNGFDGTISVIDTNTNIVTETFAVTNVNGSGQIFGPPLAAVPLQTVFLDFGQVGVPGNKTSTDVFREDGSVLMTLDKGPRAGFDPQDIGFAPGTDRDMLIQQIVDLVVEDYDTIDGQDLDLVFSTTVPQTPAYTTVSIVAGNYPDMVISNSVPGTTTRIEATTNRLALTGGSTSGYFILIEDGRLRRPDNSLVAGVSFPEFRRIKTNAFGAAQQLDRGNVDKTRNAWAFVGSHAQSADPQENLHELANTISHELGHMVGLEHRDGDLDSLLGALASYGTNKSFTSTCRDKVTELLPPCEGFSGTASDLRVRSVKVGDTDQYGTSVAGTLTGVPDVDAEELFKEARRLLETHVTHEPQFEFETGDVAQSGPGDGLYTDIPLTNGTTASFSLDLADPGIEGNFVSGRIDIDVLNVADVLGGADDLKLFVEGMELEGAFDGIDQRLADPELAGYATGARVTFNLQDYLSIADIETVMADGVLDVTLDVEGDTPFMVIDSIQAIVSDRGPDAVRTCGYGTVNLAAGRRADVLFLNGTSGGELRTVAVEAGDTIWAGILLPPAGGIGKYVLHMNDGEPQATDITELPSSIGTSCFPMLLPAATPLSVWNNIGKTHLVGETSYFGSPVSDPGKAPAVFLLLAGGDAVNLPVGTRVSIQGAIFDPGSQSSKAVSATNGVILHVR